VTRHHLALANHSTDDGKGRDSKGASDEGHCHREPPSRVHERRFHPSRQGTRAHVGDRSETVWRSRNRIERNPRAEPDDCSSLGSTDDSGRYGQNQKNIRSYSAYFELNAHCTLDNNSSGKDDQITNSWMTQHQPTGFQSTTSA
jgi:hypothetical protein